MSRSNVGKVRRLPRPLLLAVLGVLAAVAAGCSSQSTGSFGRGGTAVPVAAAGSAREDRAEKPPDITAEVVPPGRPAPEPGTAAPPAPNAAPSQSGSGGPVAPAGGAGAG